MPLPIRTLQILKKIHSKLQKIANLPVCETLKEAELRRLQEEATDFAYLIEHAIDDSQLNSFSKDDVNLLQSIFTTYLAYCDDKTVLQLLILLDSLPNAKIDVSSKDCIHLASRCGWLITQGKLSTKEFMQIFSKQMVWFKRHLQLEYLRFKTHKINLSDPPEDRAREIIKRFQAGLFCMGNDCGMHEFELVVRAYFGEQKKMTHLASDNQPSGEKVFCLFDKKFHLMRNFGNAVLLYKNGSYVEAIKKAKDLKVEGDDSKNNAANSVIGLSYLKLGDAELAVGYLEKVKDSDMNIVYNDFYLAMAYLQAKAYEKAANLLKKNAPKYASASYHYYLLCSEEKVLGENHFTTLSFLISAKNRGHPESLYLWGEQCERKGEHEEAMLCYQAAEMQGYLPAKKRLAIMYSYNPNCKDILLAAKYWEMSARQDDIEACFYVADGYKNGTRGFKQNSIESDAFYILAINSLNKMLIANDKKDAGYIHFHLAVAHQAFGGKNLNKALQHAEKALALRFPGAKALSNSIHSDIQKNKSLKISPHAAPKQNVEAADREICMPELSQEKSDDDLLIDVYTQQAAGDFQQAYETIKKILQRSLNPLAQVKAHYALVYCGHAWLEQDANSAPHHIKRQIKNHLLKSLKGIVYLLLNANLHSSERSELLLLRQAIYEEAPKFDVDLKQMEEENLTLTDELSEDTAPVPQQKTLSVTPDKEAKSEKIQLPESKAKLYYIEKGLPVTAGVKEISDLLKSKGVPHYLVGGAVRDTILSLTPRDYDLVVGCSLAELALWFPGQAKIEGRNHPLARITTSNKEIIEVSSYSQSGSLYSDFLNRDFTVNGLYYCIHTKNIYSYHDAFADLNERRLVKTICKDPAQSLHDDPTRALRLIKLLRSHFKEDGNLMEIIKQPWLKTQFKKVNIDRLFNELMKLLLSPEYKRNVEILKELTLLEYFLAFTWEHIIDGTKKYHHAIVTALDAAALATHPSEKVSPDIIVALLAYPIFARAIEGKIVTHTELEPMIKFALDLFSRNFPLPVRMASRVSMIWRFYMSMNNQYDMGVMHKHVDDVLLMHSCHFYYYMTGQEYIENNFIKTINPMLNLYSADREMLYAISLANLQEVHKLLPICNLSYVNHDGASFLHLAASGGNPRIVDVFLNIPALFHHIDKNQQTPLHYAASKGNVETTRLLLAKGFNASATDINQNTPLHLAADRDQYHVVNLLLNHNPTLAYRQNYKGETALHIALSKLHYAVAELLMGYSDSNELATEHQPSPLKMVLNNENLHKLLPTLLNTLAYPVNAAQLSFSRLKGCNPDKLTGLEENKLTKLQKYHARFFKPNPRLNSDCYDDGPLMKIKY